MTLSWQRYVFVVPMCATLLMAPGIGTMAQGVTVQRIATGLQNPRGLAVLADDRLLLVEAGDGVEDTGRISILEDHNADGDYDDPNERTPIVTNLPSYNGLTAFGTGHDEVGGTGDLLMLTPDEVYFTWDNLQTAYVVDGDSGNTAIMRTDLEGAVPRALIRRNVTVNAIVYDAERDTFFAAESGTNALLTISRRGTLTHSLQFDLLASVQQAVPAGLALDPLTGDVLVALFSGQQIGEGGQVVGFFPGDSMVMRIDPTTDTQIPFITGLTTVVDVATDPAGNIFVAELTTAPPQGRLGREYDLTDPNAPVLAGGYARYTGRVSQYAPDGTFTRVLADGLDAPTNLTYHAGVLYVSAGQGTPGRRVPTPAGEVVPIVGEVYAITLVTLE